MHVRKPHNNAMLHYESDNEGLRHLLYVAHRCWNTEHPKGATMSDLDKGFEIVIGVEGKYQSPQQAVARKDPGGETKFGISKREFPYLDIANLTIEQAKVIYKQKYWDLIKGDELPFPLNVFVFDSAVNQGVEAAKKLLQKTLNEKTDGIFGVSTLQKAKFANKEVMALYMADRALRYTGTRNFDLDGRGWLKRLFLITMEVNQT